jgi:predicted ATPase
MEPNLRQTETSTAGTWDDEHVKALLHFPRFPIRLIQHEPWQSWIGQRGGLKAVYAYLQNYPLTPTHRRILDVVLSNPEAVADVYADRLNISRATYFYQLRELVPALVQALNHWELDLVQASLEISSPLLHKPPVPLTPLVGVEAILQTLSRLLLRDDIRLLTLLGPGGIGKTRMSIELAHHLNGNVCFVDLSRVHDHTQMAGTIAKNLGIKTSDNATLRTYLSSHEFLLILDNFEQILPARDFVSDLLASAPRLKILVTSRVPLHVYGEHEFVMPPLGMPDIESIKDQQLWAQSPAVSLFLQSAQAVNPAFTLTNHNVEAVAELCLCLDGLPLAIELAAHQVKYFSPQALLTRVSNARLNFLSQVPKQMPPHQQTMRAMFDWSFGLLPADLQTLFCRLAVFSGGCTIEAAEIVCSRLDAQVGLPALIDYSLLEQQVSADGEPRFHMLSITREYAMECLGKRGETDSLKRIHALYYLQFAENLVETKDAHNHEKTNRAFQREYANLNAALRWTIEHRDGELGLRFVLALWEYWNCSGRMMEGNSLAQTILKQTSDLRLTIRKQVSQLVLSAQ